MRQSEIFFLQRGDMGRQNHAAGMAAPVHRVQGSIVFRKIGVPAVAEDTFDKIQIADQAPRDKKARLHGLGGSRPVAGQINGRSRRVVKTRTGSA